jgi:hypothetical protein
MKVRGANRERSVIKVKSVIKVTQSRKLQASTADRRWIVPDVRRVGGNVLRKSCGGTSSGNRAGVRAPESCGGTNSACGGTNDTARSRG